MLDVTEDDCRAYLDRWRDRHPNTMRHSISVLKSFFGWLYEIDEIPRNPMDRIKPPRRPNPDDLDVTTVSGADVRLLFDACETWTELLCLSTLAYLGPRRKAASNLRRRDINFDRATMRFREKGGKVITKPIPEEFAELLRTAISVGAIGATSDSYVIPMPRGQRREGDRDDRIIWRTIKKLGERAGFAVHPHSLRSAFAVRFLEGHPGQVVGASATDGPFEDGDDADFPATARPRAGDGACSGPVLGIPVRIHSAQGADRIRTGVRGFAGLCLTTRPPRRHENIVSSELFMQVGLTRIR